MCTTNESQAARLGKRVIYQIYIKSFSDSDGDGEDDDDEEYGIDDASDADDEYDDNN